MRSEIIAVGSELLSFSRSDTNSLRIASRFLSLGLRIPRKWVVADLDEEIREALLRALEKSEVVAVTGGLGPTSDDRTREVVAATLGRELTQNPEVLRNLESRYRRFGLQIKENSLRQTMVPAGAEVIPNPKGTAPGLLLREEGKMVFLLPGPPRELYPMLDDHVVPLIRKSKRTSTQILRMLKVAGEAESRLDARIQPVYHEFPEVETTILSSAGIITLYFRWVGQEDAVLANRILDQLVVAVRGKLGKKVFTDQDLTLPEVLGSLLHSQSLTLATAESCTGGLLGKLLTDIPGSSDYYVGGVVCYSNRLKSRLLGVDEAMLEREGAVSEPVAREMAEQVRRRLEADLGLSVTGIAGPGGGTDQKPVGTVFIAMASPKDVEVRRLNLPGGREMVRLRTARIALDWVRRSLQ
jgi:nicotinamide-nucleotide amidase